MELGGNIIHASSHMNITEDNSANLEKVADFFSIPAITKNIDSVTGRDDRHYMVNDFCPNGSLVVRSQDRQSMEVTGLFQRRLKSTRGMRLAMSTSISMLK